MDTLSKVVSLCKKRGFIFQSSEIYGGVKSLYDFGHLGFLLKENLKEFWKLQMLFEEFPIFFIDGALMLPYRVVKASGHIDSFVDPLVDCKKCKQRFRPDKVEKELGVLKCPVCGSDELSDTRFFNLMFRTNLGPIDPLIELLNSSSEKIGQDTESIFRRIAEQSVYLRPETAQNIFVQFPNISRAYPTKLPFGVAQIGRAFRNEITTERFLFRVAEFDQMELEFFIDPDQESTLFKVWQEKRMTWWRKILNNPEHLRLRFYDKSELAHYASACVDVEYKFPWGFDEVEGIACRTDYDLLAHQEASGKEFFVLNTTTDMRQVKVRPWVIEPSCGLTRAVLAVLLDAYSELEGRSADGEEKVRVVLRLKPFLSPIKVAVFPLVKHEDLISLAKEVFHSFRRHRIISFYDESGSIGKRYSKQDEIGTPFCVTIDFQSLEDKTVTVRDRDTAEQQRIRVEDLISFITPCIEMPI